MAWMDIDRTMKAITFYIATTTTCLPISTYRVLAGTMRAISTHLQLQLCLFFHCLLLCGALILRPAPEYVLLGRNSGFNNLGT
jgi:hypothetical protein